MTDPVRLEEHRFDVHSQFGEDGMIRRALEVLPGVDRWCVEIGAWDGRYLSNTHRLMDEEAWSGVFIEADPHRFSELLDTYGSSDKAVCINEFARYEGPNTMDRLLARTPIPRDFDLLSIDIDGNDFHLWETLTEYRPKLVVIEFNATIPNDIDFVQPRADGVHQGSSLAAFARLARSKSYELVATTDFNAFFVTSELYALFGLEDNSLDAIHTNRSYQTRVFQLMDGTLVWDGCTRLIWTGVDFKPKRLQPIPRRLRYLIGTDPSDATRRWRERWLHLLRLVFSR
jgi:hypothetical protein